MTNTELLNMIRPLLGRRFAYRGETHTIEKVSVSHDIFLITTNRCEIKKEAAHVADFVDLLLNNEVDYDIPSSLVISPANKVERIVSQLEQKVSDQNDRIFGVIDEMIEMVKNDPSKMPQAQVINDLLKTRVDAQKTLVLASKI